MDRKYEMDAIIASLTERLSVKEYINDSRLSSIFGINLSEQSGEEEANSALMKEQIEKTEAAISSLISEIEKLNTMLEDEKRKISEYSHEKMLYEKQLADLDTILEQSYNKLEILESEAYEIFMQIEDKTAYINGDANRELDYIEEFYNREKQHIKMVEEKYAGLAEEYNKLLENPQADIGSIEKNIEVLKMQLSNEETKLENMRAGKNPSKKNKRKRLQDIIAERQNGV